MRPPEWAVRTKADETALDQGYQWSEAHADHIIQFANDIFRPQYVEDVFKLLPWQERFLRSLYGWRDKDGNRRFRTANLHIAKKQGKTLLVSIISAYELLAAGVSSPFVVTGSVSKDNAGQVFAELRHTLQAAGVSRWCQVTPNQKRVRIPDLNAEYRSLASDGDRVQGYNCSLVVLDECHAMKGPSLYDSLKYATISRPDGLLVAISTAGDDPSHFYHGMYSKSKKVLAGDDLDVTWYAEVYESDAEADAEDIAEWYKANPSLGTSFSEHQFGLDLLAAKQSADRSEWWRFLRYRLNRWTRPDAEAYFDVAVWDRGKLDQEPADLESLDCYIGGDLSMTTDPSSVVAWWCLGDRRYYCKAWAWVAREGVRKREATTLPRYEQFEAEGCMEVTEGDRIDHDLIGDGILDLCRRYKVRGIVFDPTSAIALLSRMQAETGIEPLVMAQTHKNYTGPMKELSHAMAEGRIHHDGNNWLRYCLNVLRVDETRHGDIRPHTKRSLDHIDGAVAALMAYSQMVQARDEVIKTPLAWV